MTTRAARESRRSAAGRPAPGGAGLRAHAWLLGPALLAFLVRIAYLLEVRATPLYLGLGLDARFYHRWAMEIASGDIMGSGVFFMGPLYPYFLALVYAVGGPDPFHARVVQCVVGAVTVAGTALVAREIGGRAAGIAAGLLAAIYGPLVLYDVDILFPVIQLPLVAFSLWFMFRGARTGPAGRGGGVAWRSAGFAWLASGVLLGLAAVGNASVLAFAPVAAAWAWWSASRRSLRPPALLLAGVALAILPVTARNLVVGGELVPITSNAGLNLYIGNSAESSGAYIKPAGLDVDRDPEGRRPAEAALGRPVGARETSDWWASRARAFPTANPGRVASLWLKKQTLFWGNFEVPQIENFNFQRRYSALLRLPFPTFGSILGLAIAGAIALPSRWRRAGPVLLFPVVQSLAIAAFFVVARYRIAVVPALIALAAVGLVSIAGFARARDYRRAGVRAGIAAAVFALSLANPFHVRHDSAFGQCHYRQGVELDRTGDLERAEAEYRASLSYDPGYAPTHVNLGGLLARTGRHEEAARELAEAVRLDPAYPRAHYNLGASLEESGRPGEARAAYERAAALDPAWVLPREGLARVAYLEGDLDAAIARSAAVASGPAPARPEDEDPREEAMRLADFAARRKPLLARIGGAAAGGDALRILLAADVAIASGSPPLADSLYHRARRTAGAPEARSVAAYELGTLAYQRQDFATAGALFAEAEALWEDQPNLHFALGNIAVLTGDPRRGAEEFRRELARDPAHAASWLNLGACYENALGDIAAAREAYERYIALGGERADMIRQRLATLGAGR